MLKEKIEGLLMSTDRAGMQELLDYMAIQRFYQAPCSTQFHLSCEGGLAEHSLNVYTTMRSLNDSLNHFESYEDMRSLIIVSLLHDLGKMGQYNKPLYVENILKSGKSASKPYVTNKNLLTVPHEVRSLAIATQFIELTEEEQFAILMHNGLYGDFKYELNGKERPLQTLLHFADLWVSRFEEGGNE